MDFAMPCSSWLLGNACKDYPSVNTSIMSRNIHLSFIQPRYHEFTCIPSNPTQYTLSPGALPVGGSMISTFSGVLAHMIIPSEGTPLILHKGSNHHMIYVSLHHMNNYHSTCTLLHHWSQDFLLTWQFWGCRETPQGDPASAPGEHGSLAHYRQCELCLLLQHPLCEDIIITRGVGILRTDHALSTFKPHTQASPITYPGLTHHTLRSHLPPQAHPSPIFSHIPRSHPPPHTQVSKLSFPNTHTKVSPSST